MSLGIADEVRRLQREKLEKRGPEALEKRYAQQNREEVADMERKMAPPVIFIPQCHVCASEYRAWIERRILTGVSYTAIAKSVPPDAKSGKELDRRSVSNHAKEHMPLDQAVIRAVLEDEADLLNQNWEEGVKGAFTNRGALNTLIRKAYEDAMAGITTVEPRDLVQMVKLYNDMSENSSAAAVEEAKLAVRIFVEAIQNVITDEFESEQANHIKTRISNEVKRLRSRDEIEAEIESNLRMLPRTT